MFNHLLGIGKYKSLDIVTGYHLFDLLGLLWIETYSVHGDVEKEEEKKEEKGQKEEGMGEKNGEKEEKPNSS